MGKSKMALTKAYKMIAVGENDAEINMYGEVVEKHPVDWWSGEPVPGNYIAVDDFLRDLEDLSTKDNITVHINSVGGDLYAGIAIYNRLKSLPANVTTVNDGLAASAGSLIFQAGNTRKVHSGSNIMVHQAMGLLIGYYQTKDLKEVIKQLEAGNKAAVNIYAEASGRDAADMKAMVDKETWLTGQEAVDAGLADEVVESDVPIAMSLTADRTHMMVNGIALSTRGMSNIPKRIPVLPENKVSVPAAAPVDNTKGKEGKDVEIKNIEDLKKAYPDLLTQAEDAAREEGRTAGVTEERARIKGIEDIQNAIADQKLITGAKYGEKPLTAEQLALQAMQAQAAIGVKVLADMGADGKDSGTNDVGADPNGGIDPGKEGQPDPKQEIMDAVNLYKSMNGGKK